MDMLDTLLPGEFGELWHSGRFARAIVSEAERCARLHVAGGLQPVLKALRVPSDIALTSDAVTTQSNIAQYNTSLDVHPKALKLQKL